MKPGESFVGGEMIGSASPPDGRGVPRANNADGDGAPTIDRGVDWLLLATLRRGYDVICSS